jgi:hypothetical protein
MTTTKARVRFARLTAGAAALAATTTLAGPSPATAAEQTWVDGAWVSDTIISCITGQPAPGYTARVSFAGKDGELPQVGETFYFKMEVGLPGLPCNKTPRVLPELVIPAGLEYADDAQHPVRWQKYFVDGGSTGYSTENLEYQYGVNGGVVIAMKTPDYPEGGPIEVRQGQSFELQIPVRATKVMKGMATREPQCQERIDGVAPCPVDESGDHIQVAVTKLDTGPMQYVIPFVGVHVQKAIPKLGAKIAAFSTRAGKATVRLSASTLPTGAVKVFRGTKKIAGGTLGAGNNGVIALKLPKLAKGQHKLTVKYAGSKVVAPAKRVFTVSSR